MTDKLFTTDFKDQPYWWDRTPPPDPRDPDLPEPPLPPRTDVAIIGAGYTGLSAAIQTARGGRRTLLVDAEEAGWGCSTRNGGQVSTSLKPNFQELSARYGPDLAYRIQREGHNALAWIKDFVETEGIDCDYQVVGRFYAAHTPAQYEGLGRRLFGLPKGLETDAYLVPRAEQSREVDSELYHGGMVFPHHASIDPGRYHQGLLECAKAAGATVIPRCRVTGLTRESDGFRLATARGPIAARDVIVATNGYTSEITPWLRRRVIPIGSYVIATEPVPQNLMTRLMPKSRVVTDTRKLVVYYRPSPDGRRVLFGGRVSLKETDPRASAPLLHEELTRIFPELAETKVSHSWMGFVAYTFDAMPHLGRHDGAYYAMGFCGAGISLSSYFGMRLGQQVLDLAEGRTALDGVTFQTRPFYSGDPWFLAPTIRYYRWRDRLAG